MILLKTNFPVGNVSDNLSVRLTGWIWGLSEKTCSIKKVMNNYDPTIIEVTQPNRQLHTTARKVRRYERGNPKSCKFSDNRNSCSQLQMKLIKYS
jgi:hypothetical protein